MLIPGDVRFSVNLVDPNKNLGDSRSMMRETPFEDFNTDAVICLNVKLDNRFDRSITPIEVKQFCIRRGFHSTADIRPQLGIGVVRQLEVGLLDTAAKREHILVCPIIGGVFLYFKKYFGYEFFVIHFRYLPKEKDYPKVVPVDCCSSPCCESLNLWRRDIPRLYQSTEGYPRLFRNTVQ